MRKAIRVHANYGKEKGTTVLHAEVRGNSLYCTVRQYKNALNRLGAPVNDHLRCYDHQYFISVIDKQGNHYAEIN